MTDDGVGAAGMVRGLDPYVYASGRAFRWGIRDIDLDVATIDQQLVQSVGGQSAIGRGWMPVQRLADGAVLIATAVEPTPAVRVDASQLLGTRLEFAATTEFALRRVLARLTRREIADDAAHALWRRDPALSARILLSAGQLVGVIAALAVLAVGLALAPWPTFLTIGTAAALVLLLWTVYRFDAGLRGARFDIVEQISAEQLDDLDDRALPRWTVMVPVPVGAGSLGQIARRMLELDWPKDRLEVLLLVGEHDVATRATLDLAPLPPGVEVVTVPSGEPSTRGRACNIGLAVATGEYVSVFDPADEPEADQLRKVFLTFERGGASVLCVQAAVNLRNQTDSVLTRLISLDAAAWSDYVLPGLDSVGRPIPLGGSSNHFVVDRLRGLGGWDPYNFSEDGDLGMRSSVLGGRVGVVNSRTLAVAETDLADYLRRERDIVAGWAQSALVHLRAPVRVARRIGVRSYVSFLLTVGLRLPAQLAVLPLTVALVAVLVWPAPLEQSQIPAWVFGTCLACLASAYILPAYLAMMSTYKYGRFRMLLWAFGMPLLTLAQSVASYAALTRLIARAMVRPATPPGTAEVS